MKLQPVNYAKVKDIEKLVKRLLSSRGTVNVDERTNTLIIKDISSVIDEATALIKAIDTQTPQVMIEAKIVEANLDFSRELGSVWGFQSQQFVDPFDPDTLRTDLGSEDFRLIDDEQPRLHQSDHGGPDGPDVDRRLDPRRALPGRRPDPGGGVDGEGKVISSPRIVTLDNKEAKIEQGVSIPFQTFENGDAKLEFIDAVLSLKVTPHITADQSIIMKIEVTRNAPDSTVPTPTGSPAIAKNQAKTETLVKDGQTLVLGGIYMIVKSQRQSRVPYLHRIPVIGSLFKNNEVTDAAQGAAGLRDAAHRAAAGDGGQLDTRADDRNPVRFRTASRPSKRDGTGGACSPRFSLYCARVEPEAHLSGRYDGRGQVDRRAPAGRALWGGLRGYRSGDRAPDGSHDRRDLRRRRGAALSRARAGRDRVRRAGGRRRGPRRRRDRPAGSPRAIADTGHCSCTSTPRSSCLLERIGEAVSRPLLAGLDAAGRADRLAELLEARRPWYAAGRPPRRRVRLAGRGGRADRVPADGTGASLMAGDRARERSRTVAHGSPAKTDSERRPRAARACSIGGRRPRAGDRPGLPRRAELRDRARPRLARDDRRRDRRAARAPSGSRS